ncbi:MAG TPA: hypothetical protein VHG92_09350 [Afifellaceae bacterium]|nr:hypothetical protein [Afifellaceae bacterium]
MSDPNAVHRYPGYQTPEDVLADDSLSVGARIDLLEQWKKTLNRVVANDPLPEETRRRAEEIDAAISALKEGR